MHLLSNILTFWDEVTSEFLVVICDKLLAARPNLTSVFACCTPKDNGL